MYMCIHMAMPAASLLLLHAVQSAQQVLGCRLVVKQYITLSSSEELPLRSEEYFYEAGFVMGHLLKFGL